MAKVNPIPQGYSSVMPYISVKGASDAIAFYKKAFGAEELAACRCRTARSATRRSRSAIRS